MTRLPVPAELTALEIGELFKNHKWLELSLILIARRINFSSSSYGRSWYSFTDYFAKLSSLTSILDMNTAGPACRADKTLQRLAEAHPY